MNRFRQTMIDEQNDFTYNNLPSTFQRRLLIIGLYLSYIACVIGLWLTGDEYQSKILSAVLSQQIANFRTAILVVPVVVLALCYFRLHQITDAMMGGSERHLDERQRMMRDQAHRYAYKIMKLVCLLIPIYLLIHALMLNQPASPPTTLHSTLLQQLVLVNPRIIFTGVPSTAHQMYPIARQPTFTSMPVVQPYNPLNVVLYYGVLLIGIFLIVTTLPTSIIVWRERR